MPKTPDKKYDYLIVGGGISGLSHAYHLTREGYSVLVLDSENCLSNASFNSTAITSHDPDAHWDAVIKQFGIEGARDIWKLSEISLKQLRDYASKASPHFAARRLPAHIFSQSPEKTAELREQFELYKKLGAKASFEEGHTSVHSSFHSVLTVADEGQSNNQAILKSFVKIVKRQGGKILTYHPVEKIDASSGAVVVTTKNGAIFHGKEVIVATGASSGLVPGAPSTDKKRTFVLAFDKKQIPKPFKNSVMWDIEEPYHYIRSFRGRIVWVGGSDVYEKEYDPKKNYYAAVEKFAREKLGLDASYKHSGEWSGTFYPGGKLGLPYIGRIKNSPVHISYGFGGTGILTSFISGFLFTEWLRGRETQYKKFFAPDR